MKGGGVVLILLGIAVVAAAFAFPITTAPEPDTLRSTLLEVLGEDRVTDLALMSLRANIVTVGAGLFLAGVVFAAAGAIISAIRYRGPVV